MHRGQETSRRPWREKEMNGRLRSLPRSCNARICIPLLGGISGLAQRARVPCVRFPLWMGQSTKPNDVVASFEGKALANSYALLL